MTILASNDLRTVTGGGDDKKGSLKGSVGFGPKPAQPVRTPLDDLLDQMRKEGKLQ
jgi:hypothetical protein